MQFRTLLKPQTNITTKHNTPCKPFAFRDYNSAATFLRQPVNGFLYMLG